MPLVKFGKCVCWRWRPASASSLLPDVPTVAERVSGFEANNVFGMSWGTPPAVIAALASNPDRVESPDSNCARNRRGTQIQCGAGVWCSRRAGRTWGKAVEDGQDQARLIVFSHLKAPADAADRPPLPYPTQRMPLLARSSGQHLAAFGRQSPAC
jgi:hypothetical protein